jgi:dolichol-phosphate mannosyltransferase
LQRIASRLAIAVMAGLNSVGIAVAIPCYNCRRQIPRVLQRFSPDLQSRISKIWIIDNQSTDGTPEAALEAIQNLGLSNVAEVRINRSNYGLGGSHKVALLLAAEEKMDYLAITHGDDQGRADELSKFFSIMDEHPDMAAYLGSRFMPGSSLQGYSPIRIAGNLGLNVMYTTFSGRKTWDIGAGINLFRVEDLKNKVFLEFSDGFTFNMDLLLYYYRQRSSLKFVPITWTETDQISNAKTFQTGWRALKTLLAWRMNLENPTSRKPSDYRSDKINSETRNVL